MLAQSDDTLYVAFMGTKQFRDVLTNADARLVRLWPHEVIWLKILIPRLMSAMAHNACSPGSLNGIFAVYLLYFFPIVLNCHEPCKA